MKRFAMMVAAGLMVAGSMIGASLPVQAAPAPSVSVTITDGPGSSDCRLAFSVRGLEPDTHYTLLVTGSSTVGPDFTTDARGAYKSAGGTYDNYLVNGAHFNNTNTISVALFLYNAGQPPIVTGERIANRCRAS